MTTKLARIIAYLCICCICTSCFVGRYRLPKLTTAPKPDPAKDFARIREFFHRHHGEIVSRDDSEVIWKDTSMFRIYELKHHSVIIFPYNWTSRSWDIILFAGHIKKDFNPYDAIQINSHDEPKTYWAVDGVDWELDAPALADVSFHGFSLGEDRAGVIHKQTEFIHGHVMESNNRVNQVGLLDVSPDGASAYRDDLDFRLVFVRGKLAYVACSPIGFPSLDQWAIRHPKTPVEVQGRFDITRPVEK